MVNKKKEGKQFCGEWLNGIFLFGCNKKDDSTGFHNIFLVIVFMYHSYTTHSLRWFAHYYDIIITSRQQEWGLDI